MILFHIIYKKLFSIRYHLASPASPVHYQSDPIFTLKTNVYGTLNMLEFAHSHGARLAHNHSTCIVTIKCRFLLTSTSEVYGDPLEHPQKETYWGNVNPNGPRSW
jgi:UDP-glucuronate decarboxylase